MWRRTQSSPAHRRGRCLRVPLWRDSGAATVPPMTRPKVLSVVGTRPNFMKIAPIQRELERVDTIDHVLVHTGQHYDALMSDVFLDELGIGSPGHFLGV